MTILPENIESEIVRLSNGLETATEDAAKAAEAFGHAKVDYELAKARAYLAAEGPVVERQMVAALAAERELSALRLAEARYRALRETLTTYRSQLDSLRTLAASARALT